MSSGEFSSQGITQAVLVSDAEQNPGQASISLAVFNKDGTPFVPGGGAGPWQWISDQDLANGWVGMPGPDQPRVRKRQNNIVEMGGYAVPGSEGMVCYLPEDCRPLETGGGAFCYPVCCSNNTVVVATVQGDGQLRIVGRIAGVSWVNLATVRFPTD